MIAMQYRFALPADYDMAIVDRRIAERAPLLDGFPGMRLKTYLSNRLPHDAENCYATFYVWDDAPSMKDFLCGPPFAGVSRAFAWPSVRLWSVWQSLIAPGADQATHATQQTLPIAPHADLDHLRAAEIDATHQAMQHGALVATAAFDPTSWTQIRFRLWPYETDAYDATQSYRVGYTSLSATP